MEFVNPSYLYGLFAISIPIIIHLFNFRRYRKVYFSNVRLLKELQVKTKRKTRLKHLLVMLARILAITALVLAFAQPYFPAGDTAVKAEESSAVAFYIDNSFSMDARSREQVLLEQAKDMALELGGTYKTSDVFQVMTNDLLGKHHGFVSREDFSDYVQEIEVSPEVHDLNSITGRINEQLQKTKSVNKILYMISDFQKSTLDLNDIQTDTTVQVFLIPLNAVNVDNLLVDSCWLESPVLLPGQQLKLKVRIKNSGSGDYEKVPVNLILDEKQRAISPVSIRAGESVVIEMPFTLREAGLNQGWLELDDYPVTFDDKLYLSFKVKKEIPVLVINQNEENPYLNALYLDDTAINMQNMMLDKMDYSSISENRLIILNQLEKIPGGLSSELLRFVDNGGSLLLIPPALDIDMQSWNSFLAGVEANVFLEADTVHRKVDYINAEHSFFEGVFEEVPANIDLPYVNYHYRMSKRVKAGDEVLLSMQNGDVFLSSLRYGKGKLYISSTPFNMSGGNFPRHSLFVPVLYKMAIMTGGTNELYYYIGSNEPVVTEIPDLQAEHILKIKDEDSELEFIPEINRSNYRITLFLHDQVRDAGSFRIMKDEETVGGFSMNYNRSESSMEYYSLQEIKDFTENHPNQNISLIEVVDKSVSQTVNEMSKGTPLWKLFIILALAFLAMEIALIRLWK